GSGSVAAGLGDGGGVAGATRPAAAGPDASTRWAAPLWTVHEGPADSLRLGRKIVSTYHQSACAWPGVRSRVKYPWRNPSKYFTCGLASGTAATMTGPEPGTPTRSSKLAPRLAAVMLGDTYSTPSAPLPVIGLYLSGLNGSSVR